MTPQLTTNIESRIAGVIVCMLTSLLTFNSLRAAEPSAPVVDEAVWGFYSRLVGTSAQAKGGYILRWSWTKPNEELLEECVAASSGKTIATFFVTPGSKAGEFRASRSSVGGKIWNGMRQPNGTIVYIGEGLLKNPYAVSVDNDGVFQYHSVTLRGKDIASIEPATQASRYLPLAPNSASTSLPQTASSKSLSQPNLDSAVWGPLAQLVGHDWIGAYVFSVRWSKPGEEMQATWRDQHGNRVLDMVISPGSKLGLLTLNIPEGDYKSEYAGKISDGKLYFRQRVFAAAEAFHFRMIEPEVVHWKGPLISAYDGQLAYLNEPATTAPDRSVWGAFLDLVDQTWLLREGTQNVGSMYKYKWLVPGKVLIENMYLVAGQTTPRWIRHISVLPNGKLRAVQSEGAYLFEAEGIVAPDGGIEFKQLKKTLFSAPWAYRVEANRLSRPETLNTATASTPVFAAISLAEEQQLKDAYDQERLAEARRKREQSQQWTRMLEGASTALVATNQALTEVQRETQVQAAADRRRAMEAESERAALARQAEVANEGAAQRAMQQREEQQRTAAAREKTAAASARPTTVASSQSEMPASSISNSADAASVEPKRAISPTYTPSGPKSNCWTVDAPSKVATGFSRNSEQDARDEAMTNTKRCKTVSEMVCDMGRDIGGVKDGKYTNVTPHWDCRISYHCGETRQQCEVKPAAGSKQ